MLIEPLIFKLHKTLRTALASDGHYLLAVSGGSDSMALAMACCCLRDEGYGKYSVCHVEHGLRGGEALRDMALVQNFCTQHALPCCVQHVDVPKFAACERLSVETAARELRHAALIKVAQKINADGIVFAHNRDDQAETVLLRLFRGTSLRGLGGIRSIRTNYAGIIGLHPLLNFAHHELEQYCKLQGVEFCYDSTNDDMRYTRNRVRHELLPYLERAFNGSIKTNLARMACQLQAEEDFLEHSALCCFREALQEDISKQAVFTGTVMLRQFFSEKTSLHLSAKILRAADIAMRRRALRLAYYALSGRELDNERTLALEQLVEKGTGGKYVQLPGDMTAACRRQQIILEKK